LKTTTLRKSRAIEIDIDNPEWTAEMFRNACPAREVLIEDFGLEKAEMLLSGNAQIVKVGRPVSESPKKQITLRLDSDIITKFRPHGRGWQSEINAALCQWLANNQ